ncbi:MAG TPA: response regulator [Gemmatimonadales bacterium]|nr:response regulator [Gemmatimonadales bacterium]
MSASETLKRPPVVLIANDQEWSARSLESILSPNGYAVLRAYTGRQALELARTAHPDIIVLDERMPDLSGSTVCRLLRDDPRVRSHVPIVITTAEPADREQRLGALRAGAWDHFGEPLDGEMFLLKIDAWVRAKRQVDVAQEESLVDSLTGLYNMRGLALRARELGADAVRKHAPIACIAVSPEDDSAAYSDKVADEMVEHVVLHLGEIIRREGRLSDAIGRLGPTEFAIVAPATEADGARSIMERLQRAVESEPLVLPGESRTLRVRTGFYAVPDLSASALDPVELMVRAAAALRQNARAGELAARN